MEAVFLYLLSLVGVEKAVHIVLALLVVALIIAFLAIARLERKVDGMCSNSVTSASLLMPAL